MNGKELIEAIQKIPDWETKQIVYDDYENGREIVEYVEDTTFQQFKYVNGKGYRITVSAIKMV